MLKQQKRQQRETDIIESVIRQLDSHSFLELRMSDVAKAAGCSMGVIYSHFSSKEDLLLGCARYLAHKIALRFKQIDAMRLPALHALLTGLFHLWIAERNNPKYHQLRQLAMNRAVWERASTSRVEALNQQGDQIEADVSKHAQAVLDATRGQPATTSQVDQLITGLYGLTLGLFQLNDSGFGLHRSGGDPSTGLTLLFANLNIYLAGWGIPTHGLDTTIQESYHRAAELIG